MLFRYLGYKENEVRFSPKVFMILFMFCGVFIIDHIHDPSWFIIVPIGIASIVFPLVYLNVKMVYDDSGITFCDLLRRKTTIPWADVAFVMDTVDFRLARAGFYGYNVVKLSYKNKKGKTKVVRYDYEMFVGVPEFLLFYEERKNKE